MRKHHLPRTNYCWIVFFAFFINIHGTSAQNGLLAYQSTVVPPLPLPTLQPLKRPVHPPDIGAIYVPPIPSKSLPFQLIFFKKEKSQSIMYRPQIKKCPDRANALNPCVRDYLRQTTDLTSIVEKGFKYRFRVLTDGSLKRYVIDHSERIEFDREVIRVLKNRSREVLAVRGTYRVPIWMTANVKFYL